jgi:hypothetical protein
MPRHEAVTALDVYKRAGQQVMLCIDFSKYDFKSNILDTYPKKKGLIFLIDCYFVVYGFFFRTLINHERYKVLQFCFMVFHLTNIDFAAGRKPF